MTPPSPHHRSSLCFLLASTLSPRLDTWLSHIPSATKLCCFYWWNIFFFLISLFLPSFWTHFLLTCGGCDSFQQSHLDCKLKVSYNEPSCIWRMNLPQAQLWLHRFCQKLSVTTQCLGSKSGIPGLRSRSSVDKFQLRFYAYFPLILVMHPQELRGLVRILLLFACAVVSLATPFPVIFICLGSFCSSSLGKYCPL